MAASANSEMTKYQDLTKRMKQVAAEKSDLQMIVFWLTSLNKEAGLKEILQQIVDLLMDSLGGSNVIIYYKMADQWGCYDIFGEEKKMRQLDDPLVNKVVQTKQAKEQSSESVSLIHQNTASTSLSNTQWAFPLLANHEVIGVLKIEGILLPYHSRVKQNLEIFIQHISFVLKNELRNYGKLKIAYDELSQKNEELIKEINERKTAELKLKRYQEQLEDLVEERTKELAQAKN